MILNRQDKEKLVSDLYYNQSKSYRQITKGARICPRDIKAILEKPAKAMELRQSMSVSSQAYKLFSEGKRPLPVSVHYLVFVIHHPALECLVLHGSHIDSIILMFTVF
jgi:hypothetical protein